MATFIVFTTIFGLGAAGFCFILTKNFFFATACETIMFLMLALLNA